ncbi:MAG: hypothetical protein WC044_09515 [Crocinitomicaceae bacterium]
MTNNISLLFKKYSVPALFLLIAIGMLIMGVQSNQNSSYMIATILMFVAAILSFLYSSGSISTKILTMLGLVAGLGALGTMIFSTKSVADTEAHNNKYILCKAQAESNLKDIRSAQKAFAETNGRYAKDWDELIDFVKNGKVPFVDAVGVVPGRRITEAERAFLYGDNRAIDVNMTELEALRLSKNPNCDADLKGFKRDTIMVSFMDTKFKTKSSIEARMKAGLGKFVAEDLPIIPMSKNVKWTMEVKDSVQMGADFFPAIHVFGILPYARIEGTSPEEISFGKLTTNDTGGSWEE